MVGGVGAGLGVAELRLELQTVDFGTRRRPRVAVEERLDRACQTEAVGQPGVQVRPRGPDAEPPLPRRRGYGKSGRRDQAALAGEKAAPTRLGGMGGLLGKGGRGGGWSAATGPMVLGGAETPRGLLTEERGVLMPKSPERRGLGPDEGGEEDVQGQQRTEQSGYRSTRRGLEALYDFDGAEKEGSHWSEVNRFKALLLADEGQERPIAWLPP